MPGDPSIPKTCCFIGDDQKPADIVEKGENVASACDRPRKQVMSGAGAVITPWRRYPVVYETAFCKLAVIDVDFVCKAGSAFSRTFDR